jgi:hypothetical protein
MNAIKTWLPKILIVLAALVLLLAVGRSVLLFFNYMRILIAFPYNVDYGEGPILDQVMRLAHFQSIYPKDITQLPFTIGNYPPLYQLLQLPFAWIFGPAFWYGRVINLISLLAAAVFIGLILHHLTQDWLAAVVGGAFLLAVPYILHWAGFVRVDSLALGISWAGLFVITRWPNQRKGIIITALLLTGAIFTRQSYGLAAPFAAFVWLLSQKPRRHAFELAAWTGGFSVFLFLLLNILTGGSFFFNIVTANVNPFFWETVRNYWRGMWEHMPYLIVSGVFYVLVAVWLRQKAWWLAAPYFLAATISAITIGKDGSNVNYLFEFSSALALLAGLVVAWPGPAWQGRTWVGKGWWLKAILMVLLAWQISGLYAWNMKDYYAWPTNRAMKEREEIAKMTALIKDADGPILADEFMGLVVVAGKPLVFQPFEYKQLVAGQVWDEQPFLDDIFNQEFSLILLYDPKEWDSRGARWTPAQLRAIEGNYVMKMRLAQTRIYVPLDKGSFNK